MAIEQLIPMAGVVASGVGSWAWSTYKDDIIDSIVKKFGSAALDEVERGFDLRVELTISATSARGSGYPLDLELTRLQFVADLLRYSTGEGPRRALASTFAAYYRRIRDAYKVDFGNAVEESLKQIAPSDGSLVRQNVWAKFGDDLRSVLQHKRDIGYEWGFTKNQVELLTGVLHASGLMYDCLRVALVKERQSIQDSLLSLRRHDEPA